MKIFVFTYRMNGERRQCALPVYSATLTVARSKFHRRMADFGCEGDQYRVVRFREIPEASIHFTDTHHEIVEQLSPDDQFAFFQDRERRQLRQRGYPDEKTEQFLQEKGQVA